MTKKKELKEAKRIAFYLANMDKLDIVRNGDSWTMQLISDNDVHDTEVFQTFEDLIDKVVVLAKATIYHDILPAIKAYGFEMPDDEQVRKIFFNNAVVVERELTLFEKLEAARRIHYEFCNDDILVIHKEDIRYRIFIDDGNGCRNEIGRDQEIETFDDVLDYVMELQIVELETFMIAVGKFTDLPEIVFDETQIRENVMAKMQIVE